MHLSTLIQYAQQSDGVLYIMALLLVVVLAVIVDRSISLRSTIRAGGAMVRRVAMAPTLDRAQLAGLAREAGRLPEGQLLSMAAQGVGRMDHERLAQRLDEAIMLTAPSLDRRLWILDTVTTLAPLLGLFGTILGIFHSFHALSAPGHAPMQVTAGVANALVATAAGLVIAMIGLLAFNAFNNQVRLVLHQLDSLRGLILNRTDGAPACLPMAANVKADAESDGSGERRAAVA